MPVPANPEPDVAAPPGFERPLQRQPQENAHYREPLSRAHPAQVSRHKDADGGQSGQLGPGLRVLPAQRAGVVAELKEADARQLPSASAAKAKLQEKLAAHQEVGPVVCAPARPCGKPLPECGAQPSLLLAIPMLIRIPDLEIDRGISIQRSMLPLSIRKAQFLDALCAVSLQAEGARGRGQGRERSRRRRFHEEEEEAGMTLEEWEAQQGDQSMSCLALMYR